MANVELVIKISEKTYKHILSTQFYIPGPRSGKSLLEEILKAIRTGVSLPKGHGKIVDANRVLENGDNWEVETALMQTEAIIEADEE